MARCSCGRSRRNATGPGTTAVPRPARQASNGEALVAVAEAALAHEGEDRPGGERYQVIVHADEAALAHDGDGGCALEDGSALAPETVRRLACDAALVRDGRRSRTIPPATRRALRTRDRGCCFPGCENRRFLDAHHIHHWAHGGGTTLDNLVLLCRSHHRAVHEGGYSVDKHGRFSYPWGQQIPPSPQLPRGDSELLIAQQSDLEIDAATCNVGSGDRMDLALTVDAMLQSVARARSS